MAQRIKIGTSSIIWRGDEVVKLAEDVVRKELLISAKAIAKDAARRAPKDEGVLARGIKAIEGKSSKPPAAYVVVQRNIEVDPGFESRASLVHMIEYGTVKTQRQPFMFPSLDTETPKLLARLQGAVG